MFILIAIGTVIVVFVILIVIIQDRSLVKKRKKALSFLEEAVGKTDPHKPKPLEKHGIRFEYEYGDHEGRNKPSYFKVWLKRPGKGEFHITRENLFDQIFKKLSITKEIQTGDKAFDSAFYIATQTSRFTALVLSSSEKRNAIWELFSMGYNEVWYNGQTLEAKWSPFAPNAKLVPGFLDKTAENLAIIIKDLPEAGESPASTRKIDYTKRRIAIYLFTVILVFSGIFTYIGGITLGAPLDRFSVLLFSLIFSIPVFAIYMFGIVRLFRGSARTHREVKKVFLFTLASLVLIGWGLCMILNAKLDQSPVEPRKALVVKKHVGSVSHKDPFEEYYVLVESWREGRKTEKVVIRSSHYSRIQIGKTYLAIATKPGRFGFEWIVSYKI